MKLPHVQLVRQIAPQPTLADVPAAVRAAWLDSNVARRIKPGMRVAVGCGSRGIKNYLAIARATIGALKHLGAKPFVVAAMGSHGGATPDGQRELLASYHIDEARLGGREERGDPPPPGGGRVARAGFRSTPRG